MKTKQRAHEITKEQAVNLLLVCQSLERQGHKALPKKNYLQEVMLLGSGINMDILYKDLKGETHDNKN